MTYFKALLAIILFSGCSASRNVNIFIPEAPSAFVIEVPTIQEIYIISLETLPMTWTDSLYLN